MKKNYLFTLLLTLCFSALSFGQVSLPHYESFDYTVAEGIGDQANWETFSGAGTNPIDVVSGNLTYSGLANSTGNSINMIGGGEDSRIVFTEVTTGEVYASFLMNVTDISNMTDFTDGGYFAIFGSSSNNFESRLWVKPTVDGASTTVDFAFGPSSSGTGFTKTQNLNSVVLVVMSYNVETGVTNAWVNPSNTDFEAGSAPTPDFTETDSTPAGIDRILLRQDSTGETAGMILDELRLGTTWASVTPTGSVSSTPVLTINSPSNNQVFPSSTSTVPLTISASNFTLSGNNGSEMSDNTGDGYIFGSLFVNGTADGSQNIFSGTTTDIESVTPGSTYIVDVELVDNNGDSFNPKIEATVTFSVALPCDLELAEITTTCDASTSGVDTYSGTIAFTGGNTGAVYTITAPSGVTVGGDNPNTAAAGTITFSGMTEDINTDIAIVGDATSSCDLSRTLSSPSCVSFPVIEHFDYTDASTLSSQNGWTMVNSGDEMLVAAGNLDYTGLEASTGNKITFDGSGSEAYTSFSDITSGTVYASFLLKVTDISSITDLTDGGYIAALAGSTSGYDARLWVKPNPDAAGTTFDIGFGVESSSPTFTTSTYNLNDVVFVVMAYNMDDKSVSTWINPDASSFEGTIPTATISGTDASAPAAINLFILRQDSTGETPFIEIDALRISTTWADVTPKDATASIDNNKIEGFITYPNPVTSKNFTVRTNSSEKKEITIFNVLGKKVLYTSFSGITSSIDVSTISSGLYILKVTEGNKTATSKLVIK